MPIYEFQCNQCAKRFDELVRVSINLDDVVCPQCGANAPKKLMSAFGFASSGKSVASTSSGHNCGSCGSGHCGTCH